MNKKILWIWALASFILLVMPHTIADLSSEEEATQPSINEKLYPPNPRYYYDATILLIGRVFNVIEIDGFHNSHSGKGYDDKIILYGEHIWPFGIHIIWVDSEIKESCLGGGGWHIKFELFDYDGWMFGQDKTTFLNMTPLKMYGHCDKIKITVYRG